MVAAIGVNLPDLFVDVLMNGSLEDMVGLSMGVKIMSLTDEHMMDTLDLIGSIAFSEFNALSLILMMIKCELVGRCVSLNITGTNFLEDCTPRFPIG